MRTALPFVSRILAPELGDFIKNVASDVDNKTPFGHSLKKNLINSAKNVGKKILRGGKRTKRKQQKKQRKKQKNKSVGGRRKRSLVKDHCGKDIFSNDMYNI